MGRLTIACEVRSCTRLCDLHRNGGGLYPSSDPDISGGSVCLRTATLAPGGLPLHIFFDLLAFLLRVSKLSQISSAIQAVGNKAWSALTPARYPGRAVADRVPIPCNSRILVRTSRTCESEGPNSGLCKPGQFQAQRRVSQGTRFPLQDVVLLFSPVEVSLLCIEQTSTTSPSPRRGEFEPAGITHVSRQGTRILGHRQLYSPHWADVSPTRAKSFILTKQSSSPTYVHTALPNCGCGYKGAPRQLTKSLGAASPPR